MKIIYLINYFDQKSYILLMFKSILIFNYFTAFFNIPNSNPLVYFGFEICSKYKKSYIQKFCKHMIIEMFEFYN